MHARAFPLQRKGPKRILVTWDTGRHNLKVFLDGDPLPMNYNQARLPDGSMLYVGFNFVGQVKIARNYRSLPGSVDDPVSRIPVAAGVCFLMGILWVLPYILYIAGWEPTQSGSAPVATRASVDPFYTILMLAGFALIGCGIGIALRFRIALWIALAIVGIYCALMFIGILFGGARLTGSDFFEIGLTIGSLILLFRAFAGFEMLQADDALIAIEQSRALKRDVPALPVQATPPKPLMITPLSVVSQESPYLQQAENHIQRGNMDQAKALLSNFMRDNPDNAYGWYLSSFVLVERKNQIQALERALRYNPNLQPAQERLGALQQG